MAKTRNVAVGIVIEMKCDSRYAKRDVEKIKEALDTASKIPLSSGSEVVKFECKIKEIKGG